MDKFKYIIFLILILFLPEIKAEAAITLNEPNKIDENGLIWNLSATYSGEYTIPYFILIYPNSTNEIIFDLEQCNELGNVYCAVVERVVSGGYGYYFAANDAEENSYYSEYGYFPYYNSLMAYYSFDNTLKDYVSGEIKDKVDDVSYITGAINNGVKNDASLTQPLANIKNLNNRAKDNIFISFWHEPLQYPPPDGQYKTILQLGTGAPEEWVQICLQNAYWINTIRYLAHYYDGGGGSFSPQYRNVNNMSGIRFASTYARVSSGYSDFCVNKDCFIEYYFPEWTIFNGENLTLFSDYNKNYFAEKSIIDELSIWNCSMAEYNELIDKLFYGLGSPFWLYETEQPTLINYNAYQINETLFNVTFKAADNLKPGIAKLEFNGFNWTMQFKNNSYWQLLEVSGIEETYPITIYLYDVNKNLNVINKELNKVNNKPSEPIIYIPMNNSIVNNSTTVYHSSDLDNDIITYYIYVDDILKEETQSNTTNLNLEDGSYKLSISAFDGTNFSENTTVYFTLDRSAPQIIKYLPEEKTNNLGTVNLSFMFSDDRDLYNFNISFIYFNDSAIINGTNYYYFKSLNSSAWENKTYNINVRVCDSHTKNKLKYLKDCSKADKTIICDNKNEILEIESENPITLIKGNDRINFLINDITTGSTTLKFNFKTNKLIKRENSGYIEHYVINDKYWFDLDNSGLILEKSFKNNILTVRFITQNQLNINSIGELNCIENDYLFNLSEYKFSEPTVPPYNFSFKYSGEILNITGLFNPDYFTNDTKGVLMLFFSIFFWFILLIVGYVFKIPLINILVGILGFFVSYLIYTMFSWVAGFIFGIINIIIIIISFF